LATGRWWTNPAPQGKQIRQHKLSLPADANPARRAHPIRVCPLAGAFRRLSVRGLHAEFHLRTDRRATAGALGEGPGHVSNFHLAEYYHSDHLARGGRDVGMCVVRAIEVNRLYQDEAFGLPGMKT